MSTALGRLYTLAGSASVALSLAFLAGCPSTPTYPACNTDQHCHEREFCVNGQCQQCRNDSDCAVGESCNAGRCERIQGYCNTTTDCGMGEECQGNRCTRQVTQTEELPPPPPSGPCQLSAVYFDFEAAELSSSARNGLESVARCINERELRRVTVVGHCDPRGTEEYNLALGDRRARAASSYLTSLGVGRDVVVPMSRGEEDARGEDESGWSQDRRVDFRE